MKGVVKAALILMVILTVIYFGMVVYANTSNYSDYSDVVYAAYEYESGTPDDWYRPEQLGIVEIVEHGILIEVVVDPQKEPFPLQQEQPIFKYNDNFYRVSALWVTPGLPESVKQWQIPVGGVLGVGWVLAGLYSSRRKKRK